MIAALPMYDWPEERAVVDAFWAAAACELRDAGIVAPEALTRDRDAREIWGDPDLLLGQTCGLPFVTGRCGGSVVVARPDHAVEGAGAGFYSSALVCRRDDAGPVEAFRGTRAAVNEFSSQSGCHALADAVPETDFFAEVVISGAHRASALAVARGEADLAAIDAVAWALFARHEPDAAGALTAIGWTRPVPALPFIAASAHAGQAAALVAALAAAARTVQGAGVPVGVLAAQNGDYAPIRAMSEALAGRRLAPGTPALPV